MNILEYFEWENNTYRKAKDQMPDWRLGQAFYIEKAFYIESDKSGVSDSDLFYEPDEDKARDLIFKKYNIG